MSDDLLFLPATRAAAMIRRGALSPVAYVRTVLDAIDRAQPAINAFVGVCREEAMAAAAAAEAAVAAGGPLGPLHGVPVSIKDLIDVAGQRTTHGSHVHAENVARADSIAVGRLRAAGAIIVGKTTTPEFGHKGITTSPLTGITRNPWNLAHTPGGSSGGASAAVAAGLAPLALGTDGAGSIRGPAASAGIVGLKPTRGAIPHEAARDVFLNQSFAGPMTRTVADATAMFAAMAGPDPRDPWSQRATPAPLPPHLQGDRLDGVRIGYVARMANPVVDPEVERRTLDMLAALTDLGAEVEEVTDAIDWIEPEGRILYQTGIAAAVAPLRERWGNRLDPTMIAFADWGLQYGLLDRIRAEGARSRLYQTVQALFGRYQFLVSPTTARTALAADFDATRPVTVAGRECGITRQSWTAYQYPFNLTGNPAMSIPSGFAADGLPTGLQIIGPWWSDYAVLRLAALLEGARPWAGRRPPALW
ncbi:glutamyl-tRNA amidotransferase subunit A [Allostella vacuolata]|nr:glutamyl-tRNA amidotransferase subunit A [Stella vacuolata]